MVLFALVSDASIGYLFLGGAVPGLLMAAVLMAHQQHDGASKGVSCGSARTLRKLPVITFRAFPALMMPVILLGGIYGGVTTPTEAAAIAAAYAFLISILLYRDVSARQVYEAVLPARDPVPLSASSLAARLSSTTL